MVYVDLNPIRAGLAQTPEESDFTSIQERIRSWQKETVTVGPDLQSASVGRSTPIPDIATAPWDPTPDRASAMANPTDGMGFPAQWLCPIQSGSERRGILQMSAVEYFELVDKSGRLVRSDKRTAINADLAPILLRIGANPDVWIETVTGFGSKFRLAAGLRVNLRNFADQLGPRWLTGAAAARNAFASSLPQCT